MAVIKAPRDNAAVLSAFLHQVSFLHCSQREGVVGHARAASMLVRAVRRFMAVGSRPELSDDDSDDLDSGEEADGLHSSALPSDGLTLDACEHWQKGTPDGVYAAGALGHWPTEGQRHS